MQQNFQHSRSMDFLKIRFASAFIYIPVPKKRRLQVYNRGFTHQVKVFFLLWIRIHFFPDPDPAFLLIEDPDPAAF